jgi:hypothetical protein
VFSLYEADGDTARASLGITRAGTAVLNLYDSSEALRATMQVSSADAQAHVNLMDEISRGRVQLGLSEDGSTGVVILDQWGHRRATLNVTAEGEPVLAFFDSNDAPLGGFINRRFASF